MNENKTDLIIKLMIMAAIYEFMFMHKTPIKVIINEYLKVSDFFVDVSQKSFLNGNNSERKSFFERKDFWLEKTKKTLFPDALYTPSQTTGES